MLKRFSKYSLFVFVLILLHYLPLSAQSLNKLKLLENQIAQTPPEKKAKLFCKIAIGYLTINPDKSILFANQALETAKKQKNKFDEAEALNIIGAFYFKKKNYRKSAKYFENELKIRETYGDEKYLARAYYNLATIFNFMDKTRETNDYYEKSLKISDTKNYNNIKYNCLVALYKVNFKNEKYKEALIYYKRYISMKNASLSIENESEINVLTSEYESELEKINVALEYVVIENETLQINTDRKDVAIKILNADKIIQEKELQNGKLKRNILVLGLVFIVIVSGLLLFMNLIKRKANVKLEKQNAQIHIQNEEIVRASNIIKKKNFEITQSINYAERIQQAILPSMNHIISVFPENFIIFKPKDVVSGDFYWFHEIENSELNAKPEKKYLLAAADCTGHGVPGAFMSMIGMVMLKDFSTKLNDPAKILQQLNKGIKSTLSQRENVSPTHDGMDIALCHIDTEELKIYYSGANRPLWHFKKATNELIEFKPTKKAIGGFTENDQEFETHIVQLEKEDTIYMFSDGYPDQFGGLKSKKILIKRLRTLIKEFQHLSMIDQGSYLEDFFESWKGDHFQIDDVMVIGIKI